MRFYKILKAKQCGNAEGLTAYERQFVEYLKKIDIKTITGVLPLTFTATEDKLRDWEIRGNNDVGENIVPPIRIVNGWKQGYRNYINGDYVPTYSWGEWLYDVYIPINSASFTFWATNISAPSISFYFYDSDKQYLSDAAKTFNNYNNPIISNISPEAAYMQFAFRTLCKSEQEIIDNNYQVMLVKGSTAPDHYIPYQQGVGERTVNLFDVGTSRKDYVSPTSQKKVTVSNNILSFESEASGQSCFYRTQPLDTLGTVTISALCNMNNTRFFIRLRNASDTDWLTSNDTSISGMTFNNYYKGWFVTNSSTSFSLTTTIPNCKYYNLGFGIAVNGEDIGKTCELSNIMLVKSSTASQTYIPFGYQVPIIISQDGGTDKNYDIFVGSAPLTEGQQVSKTSTGQDIELFEGENTVSTTLYNKPDMEIKYK